MGLSKGVDIIDPKTGRKELNANSIKIYSVKLLMGRERLSLTF